MLPGAAATAADEDGNVEKWKADEWDDDQEAKWLEEQGYKEEPEDEDEDCPEGKLGCECVKKRAFQEILEQELEPVEPAEEDDNEKEINREAVIDELGNEMRTLHKRTLYKLQRNRKELEQIMADYAYENRRIRQRICKAE